MSRKGPKIKLPSSATMLAKRSKKKRIEVPEEGADWQRERDTAITEAERVNLFAIAKQNLGVWCHQESIDDAECQRLADLINYKTSEAARLRKPPPEPKVEIQPVPTDIAKEAANKIEEWRLLEIGETICEGDEQTRYSSGDEVFYPVTRGNIGMKVIGFLQFRRRVEPEKQAADVPEGWRELREDEKDGRFILGAKWKFRRLPDSAWDYALWDRTGSIASNALRIIVPIETK